MPGRAADHEHARRPLVPRARRAPGSDEVGCDVEHVQLASVVADVDADVGDAHPARRATRPGSNSRPGLQRGEADRLVRAHRLAAHLAGRAVDPRRDVDREHVVRPTRANARGHQRGVALERAAEAGAEHRVDREVARARARGAAPASVDAVGQRELVDTDARAPRSRAAATRPSAPLLPLPHTTTTRRP